MEALKILQEEHKNISKAVNALNKECKNLESGSELDKDFFEKAIFFISNYADKFHHAKEEDTLFKEFCKSPNLHCNPVEQMLYEHNLGRDFVKGMKEGVKENNKKKLIENAAGYAQLINEHIFKEDNILYPMAEQVLNKKVKTSMLKKFKQREKEYKKIRDECLSFLGDLR